nr:MAG TPA: phospholipase D [Caudoviricetes sp.]
MTKDRLHAKLCVWDLGRLYFYSCNLERVRTLSCADSFVIYETIQNL